MAGAVLRDFPAAALRGFDTGDGERDDAREGPGDDEGAIDDALADGAAIESQYPKFATLYRTTHEHHLHRQSILLVSS